ncbi:MAG: SAM-dependent methyltransferase [Pseudomonadota bacterium]
MKFLKMKYLNILSLVLALGFLTSYAVSAEAKSVQTNRNGSYSVVGIGPGDADLLTARAVRVIQQADLVFCNPDTREKLSALINFKNKQVVEGYGVLFRYYRKDCAKISLEERGRHKMTCEQYHEKQAEFAHLVRKNVTEGRNVVMLSSGDPTIYGPDIWSLEELADLHPVLVPGLSSFNAATAALKVSLGEVTLTAPFKGKDGKEDKDSIENLMKHDKATVVIFMPRDMDDLLKRLSNSCSRETPMAVVSHAGEKSKEKVILGTVADMGEKLAGQDVKLSLIYVGKALADAQYMGQKLKNPESHGKFYLVGAGPGDADLATLRALEVIQKSDIIFAGKKISDRFKKELAGKTVLDGYHRLFPFYGKKCSEITEAEKSREKMGCEEYHQKQAEVSALVRKAVAEGKTVAMLDSGDPLIYGPCSWTLKEFKDLNTEVVPGLSCFNAANAALGQGVTEGKNSHSVILASGWSVEEMAALQSTMVLFTMRTELKTFIDALSRHYTTDTPVAIVSSAGYSDKEKVLRGKLGSIMGQTGQDKLPFEYLLYVGDFLDGNTKP